MHKIKCYFLKTIAFNVNTDQWLGSVEGGITRCNWIEYFLVECPNFVPLHHNHRTTASLRQDELLQALNSQTLTQNSSDSWQARIVPTKLD